MRRRAPIILLALIVAVVALSTIGGPPLNGKTPMAAAAAVAIFGLPVVIFGLAGMVVSPYAAGVVMVLFAPWWRPALARVTRPR